MKQSFLTRPTVARWCSPARPPIAAQSFSQDALFPGAVPLAWARCPPRDGLFSIGDGGRVEGVQPALRLGRVERWSV